MEEMRESYDNVAFLYVSDSMAWGRKNIKDKENDLYFVGNVLIYKIGIYSMILFNRVRN